MVPNLWCVIPELGGSPRLRLVAPHCRETIPAGNGKLIEFRKRRQALNDATKG